NGFVIANVTALPDVKAGCWFVEVKSGDLSSKSEKFAIAPSPTLTSATYNDKFIFPRGNDLVDFAHCGGQQVSFKIKSSAGKDLDAKVVEWNNGKPTLELPDEVKGSKDTWKVRVLLNGNAVAANGEVDLKPISQ